MDRFNKTLKLLDNLISKLEANTGGEVKASNQPKTEPCVKPTQQTTANETPKVITDPATLRVEQPAKVQKKDQKQKKDKKTEKVQKAGGKVEQTTDEAKKQKKTDKKADKKEQKAEDKKQEKKEQKKEEKKQKQDVEATVEDFAAIDIRIGEIVQCWKHPQSEKLYCQKINVCGQVREIASGLQQFVPQDEMKGLVIVMANLKPRPLAKFMSNGMVVCASNADHTDVRIIRPQGAISERVYLEGHQALFKTEALLPVLNPKKKILQRCLEQFKTDGEGFVTWKGIKVRTSGGYLKSQLKNGTVS